MQPPATSLPSQKELEKEISDYLAKKYGTQVRIISPQTMAAEDEGKAGRSQEKQKKFEFNTKPEELAAFLDEYVIRQDEAKAILATKICTHFNRVRHAQAHPLQARRTEGLIKNNVLLIGPTGVGKTYLIKLIARKLGVPFIKGDATKFSETGYVGGDVEDLVRDLVREADDDIEAAQYGIIYLDEVDKIAASPNRIGIDVSRTGVQRALLKPMEETEVDLKVPHDPISQVEAIEHYRATGKRPHRVVNTRNILFIMSGAFTGLEEIIKRRVQSSAIGFGGEVVSKRAASRYLRQVRAEDLIEFGFESEFIGRLPVVAVLDELSENDLFLILGNPNSPVVIGKKIDFLAYGISLQFTENALRLLARLAHQEKTGARGLVSVMERTLMGFEKKLPSTDIRFLAVDTKLVENPPAALEKLLSAVEEQSRQETLCAELAAEERSHLTDYLRASRAAYLARHGVQATAARLQLMARLCQENIMETGEACDLLIAEVEEIRNCGRKISEKSGVAVFFSEEAVDRILAIEQPLAREKIESLCASLLAKIEYGLQLLREKKDLHELSVPAAAIDDPERFINDLVKSCYRE